MSPRIGLLARGFRRLDLQRFPQPSPTSSSSGLKGVASHLQWRDRAGFSPDFPVTPFRASERLFSYRVRYIPQTCRPCQSEIQTYESNSTTESNRLSSPPRPAHKDKVRPHLKRLHLAAPSFQCRQDRQSGRRLANATMSARNDQSWRNHIILLFRIVIDSQPNKDRSHRGTEQ